MYAQETCKGTREQEELGLCYKEKRWLGSDTHTDDLIPILISFSFSFLIKELGRRGRSEWLPYLSVTIVAPYPLGPEGTGEP